MACPEIKAYSSYQLKVFDLLHIHTEATGFLKILPRYYFHLTLVLEVQTSVNPSHIEIRQVRHTCVRTLLEYHTFQYDFRLRCEQWSVSRSGNLGSSYLLLPGLRAMAFSIGCTV